MTTARKALNEREVAERMAEQMIESRSFWSDARRRFFQHKLAVISVFVLGAIVAFALFGGLFAQWNNEEIDWSLLGKVKEGGAPSLANGHYFGVDELGRDLYARMVQASRASLLVGFVAAIGALMIGTTMACIAGYYGGKIDAIIIAAEQITVSIPYIIFFVVWQAFFGRSLVQLILVMVIINWANGLYVVRGQVIMLRSKEFVDAARLMGMSDFKIIVRHILPNILGIMIIYSSLAIPNIIMYESIVSFLGVGIQEPSTSWGKLLAEGASTMQFGVLWQFAFPAGFFMLTQVALYYIGDGLRDAFDPRDR